MIASLIFKPKYKSNINRALIKLDISSLEHNLDVLNQIKNKECAIMAAVKLMPKDMGQRNCVLILTDMVLKTLRWQA